MKNTILTLVFFLVASTQVVGQVKVNTHDATSIEQQMTRAASYQLKLSANSMKNAMITGVLSGACLWGSTKVEFGKDGFYLVGGGLAIASLVNIINVPIHLNRSSAYFTASANGVKLTF
tara:strand:+ start:330 stop:686 length:357 start_codon:yes stop_codon:yes gene_type:complete